MELTLSEITWEDVGEGREIVAVAGTMTHTYTPPAIEVTGTVQIPDTPFTREYYDAWREFRAAEYVRVTNTATGETRYVHRDAVIELLATNRVSVNPPDGDDTPCL